MYKVYAWRYTGYNAVNLPDRPERLKIEKAKEFPALDVLQSSFLSSIEIRAYFAEAIGIDYIALWDDTAAEFEGNTYNIAPFPLGTVFYVVNSIQMKSKDVAVLSVSQDFITTAGGIENITFRNAIISRRSLSDTERQYVFINNLEDEYIGFTQNPIVIAHALPADLVPNHFDANYDHFIECTIDLKTYKSSYVSVTDPGTGETTQVPQASPTSPTDFYIDIGLNAIEIPNPTGGHVYLAGETNPSGTINVNDSLALLRARGIENAVVSSYAVPTSLTYKDYDSGQGVTSFHGLHGEVHSKALEDISSYYEFDLTPRYGNVRNVYRCMFNNGLFKYGILASSGNRLEASPNDLRPGTGVDLITAPRIMSVADPRSTGRPYFAFSRIYGHNLDKRSMLFRCIAGCNWSQVPLVFRGASGSEIIQQKYNLHASTRNWEHGIQNASANFATKEAYLNANMNTDPNLLYWDRFKTAVGGLTGMSSSLGGSTIFGEEMTKEGMIQTTDRRGVSAWSVNPLAVAGGLAGAGASLAQSALMQRYRTMQGLNATGAAETYAYGLQALQEAQRAEELYALGVNLNNVTPEIDFAGDVNTIRDLTQNGVMVYRYVPSESDVARINNVLQMFGAKVNQFIADGGRITFVNDENSHETWDYIQVSACDVESTRYNRDFYHGTTDPSLPQSGLYAGGSYSERAAIARQLSTGVRFHHEDVNGWDALY